jgi:hypothetical protein
MPIFSPHAVEKSFFLITTVSSGPGLDVETSCSDTHRANIEATVREVDSVARMGGAAPNSWSGAAREQHARSRGRYLEATLPPARLMFGERIPEPTDAAGRGGG